MCQKTFMKLAPHLRAIWNAEQLTCIILDMELYEWVFSLQPGHIFFFNLY